MTEPDLNLEERAEKAERERDEARAFGARLREVLERECVKRHDWPLQSKGRPFCKLCERFVDKDPHAPDCLLHPDAAPADPQAGRVAELERALEPFAKHGAPVDPGGPDLLETLMGDRVKDWFDVSDFEAARAALSSTAESGWRPISEAADAIRASRPVLVTHIPFTGRAPINCVRWCGGPQKSGLRWRIVGHERKPLRYEPTHFQEIEEPVNPARLDRQQKENDDAE